MRLLLDTHVFIWWDSDPSMLSPRAAELLANPGNELALSAASVWQMQIELQLRKLELGHPLGTIVAQQQSANGLAILPIRLEHALSVAELPTIHRDPFDRMLVAQAKVERMVLVTNDATVAEYPVTTIW